MTKRLYSALRWLIDDMSDAGEDRNPETGDIYDSCANAYEALKEYEEVVKATKQKEDIVRVLRIVEYVGPRSWVEGTVRGSIHGYREFGTKRGVKAVTLGDYPEILERALPDMKWLDEQVVSTEDLMTQAEKFFNNLNDEEIKKFVEKYKTRRIKKEVTN